jgi:hypothetical protein
VTRGIKQCPKCKNMIGNRTLTCKCGYVHSRGFVKGTNLPLYDKDDFRLTGNQKDLQQKFITKNGKRFRTR